MAGHGEHQPAAAINQMTTHPVGAFIAFLLAEGVHHIGGDAAHLGAGVGERVGPGGVAGGGAVVATQEGVLDGRGEPEGAAKGVGDQGGHEHGRGAAAGLQGAELAGHAYIGVAGEEFIAAVAPVLAGVRAQEAFRHGHANHAVGQGGGDLGTQKGGGHAAGVQFGGAVIGAGQFLAAGPDVEHAVEAGFGFGMGQAAESEQGGGGQDGGADAAFHCGSSYFSGLTKGRLRRAGGPRFVGFPVLPLFVYKKRKRTLLFPSDPL